MFMQDQVVLPVAIDVIDHGVADVIIECRVFKFDLCQCITVNQWINQHENDKEYGFIQFFHDKSGFLWVIEYYLSGLGP
jgi:hypothetical protein